MGILQADKNKIILICNWIEKQLQLIQCQIYMQEMQLMKDKEDQLKIMENIRLDHL